MASLKLGSVQLEIMRVLWKRGAATAREITDDLNSVARATPTAHSTVQTLLRQMEAKGAVTHDQDGRTFVFRAVRDEKEVALTATRELLGRVFGGSVSGLVAHLLTHEKISTSEMRRLRRLIEEVEN